MCGILNSCDVLCYLLVIRMELDISCPESRSSRDDALLCRCRSHDSHPREPGSQSHTEGRHEARHAIGTRSVETPIHSRTVNTAAHYPKPAECQSKRTTPVQMDDKQNSRKVCICMHLCIYIYVCIMAQRVPSFEQENLRNLRQPTRPLLKGKTSSRPIPPLPKSLAMHALSLSRSFLEQASADLPPYPSTVSNSIA
jgi:hypothetical protein